MFIPRNKQPHRDLPPPPSFRQFIAKTFVKSGCTKTVSLYDHAVLAGLIAKRLAGLFSSSGQQLFSAAAFWYAAAHDIGKINPYFFCRIAINLHQTSEPLFCSIFRVLRLGSFQESQRRCILQKLAQDESMFGYHPGIGSLSFMAQYETQSRSDYASSAAKSAAKIILRHHGWSTGPHGSALAEALGGPTWQQERAALLEQLREQFEAQLVCLDEPTAQLWSGLVSLSDWLASSELSTEVDDHDLAACADRILEINKFSRPRLKPLQNFSQIFKDSNGYGMQPRPLQETLPQIMQHSRCCVVQCPTGSGKTEAALYTACLKICHGEAHGLYFALPTRLTALKIYERLQAFLDQILEPGSTFANAFLLQGDADLMLTQAGAECVPGKTFFSSNRTKLLAPFAAGTIDQTLLAVLPVKFNFIRLFGLADKVVIFDEVHSYDAYVSTLLRELIDRLQAVGSTVIILSATLSLNAMRSLLNADAKSGHPAYPCITYKQGDKFYTQQLPIDTAEVKPCRIEIRTQDQNALTEAIRLAQAGCQVLWIENNVSMAQQIFREIKQGLQIQGLDLDVGLLHSRFIPAQRRLIENKWMERLGKTGFALRHANGSILIGTQILEQSLDFDADVLFTRLAPIDFIIQRIGRLWRFATTPRPPKLQRTCFVLAPEPSAIDTETYRAFGASARVYEPYILARTLEVVRAHADTEVIFPQCVPELLEEVYAERNEQGVMADFKAYVEEGCPALGSKGRHYFARQAAFYLGQAEPLPLSEVYTRYVAVPQLPCLLLAENIEILDSGLGLVLLQGREKVILDKRKLSNYTEIRKFEFKLKENIVMINSSDKIKSICVNLELFNELKSTLFAILSDYIYNNKCYLLIGVVKDNNVAFIQNKTSLIDLKFCYDSTEGWYKDRLNNVK